MKAFNKAAGTVPIIVATLAFYSGSATAGAILFTTFYFSASCDDCAGDLVGEGPYREVGDDAYQPVTGSLELSDFVPGEELSARSHIFTFEYGGSSIIDPFSIRGWAPNFGQLFGTLDADGFVTSTLIVRWSPAVPTEFPRCFFLCELVVEPDGRWKIRDGGRPRDIGINGTFAGTPVPEPATLAILGLGLAGLGFARRRRTV